MDRQYTVEDLEQYRLWWSRLVDDVSRIAVVDDDPHPLDDADVEAVREVVLTAAAVSGEGESRQLVQQFSRQIQGRDRSSADVAEFAPFGISGTPRVIVAPTALDASVSALEFLAWEFFERGVEEIRQRFSLIEFNELQIRRMECRMEREASLLMDAESIDARVPENAAQNADEDWPVTLEEFMRLTMKDGKGGTSWPSIYQFTGRARRELGEDVLPLRPKLLPYLKAAEIWNRTSTTPVPATVEAARRHLESAQSWRIRSRPR